jgi:hypothetical protein
VPKEACALHGLREFDFGGREGLGYLTGAQLAAAAAAAAAAAESSSRSSSSGGVQEPDMLHNLQTLECDWSYS